MRRQVILVVTAFVFALILCGAVSAENTTGGELLNQNTAITSANSSSTSQNDSNFRIHGLVREIFNESSGNYTNLTNAIPVKNATITIKNPTTNAAIASGTTNSTGEYDISFLSNLTEFRVKIAYSTYKTFITNVTPTGTLIPQATLNHIFMPDIAIISSVAEKAVGIRNLNNRRLIYLDMWNPRSSPVNDWIMEHVNFAFLDMAMPGTGWGDSWYDEILRSPANLNNMISSAFGWPGGGDTDTGGPDNLGLRLLGFKDGVDTIDTLENTIMGSYYALASGTALQTNLQHMVEYIYYLLGETTINPVEHGRSPVMGTPNWGIYHPDHPEKIVSSAPTQAQVKEWIRTNPGFIPQFYSLRWIDQNYTAWATADRNRVYQEFENWYNTARPNITGPFIVIVSYGPGGPAIDALIREFESQGRAVLNLFQGATNPPKSRLLEELVRGKDGIGPLNREVSAVVSLISWSLNYPNIPRGGALSELERIDLPVIRGVQLLSQASLTNPLGAQFEWTFQVVFPYFEGVFSPIVISYTDENGFERPIDAGIKKIVSLTNGWARLRELSNSEKKIAVILYNYPPGRAKIGATYLDVFQSVHDLLVKLREQGYNVGTEKIPSVEELYSAIARFGNKGSWVQNLLNEYVQNNLKTLQINGQLVNASTYIQWFNQLPEALKEQVISEWGQPIGNIMNYNGSLVIPGMMFGNIFLTVQPSRGWEEVENYHDPHLPPHHQYIAFYRWLENVFGANAMIHIGTHGTLEWLPGRHVGLQKSDWPFQLTKIPNINPYIVSNPGEGMVAKDRAGALIISHMTPAMVRSGLYGDLIEIHDLVHQYENAITLGNFPILPALERQIKAKAQDLRLQAPQQGQNFSEWLREIHLQLHEIKNEIIPLGLHSLGRILTGDELVEAVFTIAASRTNITDNMKTMLYPEITLGYFDIQNNPKYEDEIKAIDNRIREYIRKIADGKNPADLGVKNADLLADLKFCKELIGEIRDNHEWKHLLEALGGRFVTPGLSADPSYADVLPTGMNFYASNPRRMPTRAAWETAKRIVHNLLADHYKKHGRFPKIIGTVMWGTELLRTDGIAIAKFMYLLGVTPVWERGGNVRPEPALIPLENLTITIDNVTMRRPRIDVFTTAVTGNEMWINLMNRAVKLASEAPGETAEWNYVIKHIAKDPSLDRIFGLPGLVLEGTGVSDMVPNTGRWQISDELANVYLSRVSHAWRSTPEGVSIKQNRNTFQNLLKNADIITKNIDSTWGLLDSCDFYDWYGGMILASRSLGGNPEGMLVDIRNKNRVVIRTTSEQTELEIRSKLLNPKYMDSLLNTPSGWIEYAKRFEHLFGMDVTTNSVSHDMWTMVGQNLLSHRFTATRDFQAFATQSMLGWVIEASRRDLWKADSGLLTALKDKHISLVNQFGVSCCHHTCANMVFNQFVVMGSSLSLSQLQQFANTLKGATGRTVNIPTAPGVTPAPTPGQPATATPGTAPGTPGRTQPTGAAAPATLGETGDEGQRAYEVAKAAPGAPGQAGVPVAAIAGVLLLLCLIGAGYFKAEILSLLGFAKK